MPKGMTNIELKEFMHSFKSEIKAELSAQTTIIDKMIMPKINEIAALQKEANGKVADHEKRISERDWFCLAAQDVKKKASEEEIERKKIEVAVLVEEKKRLVKKERVMFVVQTILAACVAAIILHYGVLEFLKLIK